MSEYWKSTPSYWCKFCSQYVRDTSIERKNHEASAKHQNNIQRSLRELHKGQERERRDKQAAKDEVARLNGLFDGSGKATESKGAAKQSGPPGPRVSQPAAPAVSTAAQRKAHAEQLAAMGVELPEELKKEVTGVGNYHVVSAREVEPGANGAVSVNRSLADILAEARKEEAEGAIKDDLKAVDYEGIKSESAAKRKAEDDEDYRDEEAAPKRKAWGSDFKKYSATKDTAEDFGDLDALLSGVKKKSVVKPEKVEDEDAVKKEDAESEFKQLDAVPDINNVTTTSASQEDSSAAPAVVFKKRKGKK